MEQPTKPMVLKDQKGKSIAVRAVRVHLTIDGPIGLAVTKITFNNDTGAPVEGDLVFPLPPFGSVQELVVRVGEREIRGKFKARDRAQADYGRAVQAGHTAVLGETEGEDLCRLRVAPIGAGEDVEVRLVVVAPLAPVAGGFRAVIPLTYMPRYVEDPAKQKPTEAAAVDRPRPAKLAARAHVSVEVLNSCSEALGVTCRTHELEERGDADQMTYEAEGFALDRDLILAVTSLDTRGPCSWVRYEEGPGADGRGPATALALIPPRRPAAADVIPRDLWILLDQSGSMDGEGDDSPIGKARRAASCLLRSLGHCDRFNIVAFNAQTTAFREAAVPLSDASLKQADAFIEKISAGGGTEACNALRVVLGKQKPTWVHDRSTEVPSDPGMRLRVVVMLTDGDVSGAEDVIAAARESMQDSRLFAIGIGDSVDHAQLSSLAAAGKGTYYPVGGDDLEEVVGQVKSAIDAPLVTGVKVRIGSGGEVRDAPSLQVHGSLDLFCGAPLVVAFRGELEPGAQLILSGQQAGGSDFRMVADVGERRDGVSAALVWALLRNQQLTYRFCAEDDASLEELGVTFGLANRCAALVGVHEDPRGIRSPETVPVVLPLPRNLAGQESNLEAQRFGAAPICFAMGMPDPEPKALLGGGGPTLCASFIGDEGMAGILRDGAKLGAGAQRHKKIAADRWVLSNDAAGLRSLVGRQGADGLWADLGATLMAVLALVSRGHTASQGSFRAELRKTAAALSNLVAGGALTGTDGVLASEALRVLSDAEVGEPIDPEAAQALAQKLAPCAGSLAEEIRDALLR